MWARKCRVQQNVDFSYAADLRIAKQWFSSAATGSRLANRLALARSHGVWLRSSSAGTHARAQAELHQYVQLQIDRKHIYRSLISRAIVRKACSTLTAVLAEVSKKGIPSVFENS